MKLDAWLEAAGNVALNRLRMQSPRGHEVLCGPLGSYSAEELTSRAKEDAATLPRDRKHEYILLAEADNGERRDRYSLRIEGGERPDDGHHVEPSSVQNAGAALGHLVRLVVEQSKQISALANSIAERDKDANKELRRTERALMRSGEVDLQKLILQHEYAKGEANRATTTKVLEEAISFGKLALGRASPDAAAAALTEFRDSLTDAQLAKLPEILGAVPSSRLLSASTPAKFCDVAMGLEGSVFAEVGALLTEPQQRLLAAAIGTEMQKRANARSSAPELAAKPSPTPTANGAAS